MGAAVVGLLLLAGCGVTVTRTITRPGDVLVWEKPNVKEVNSGTGTLTEVTCWCNARGDWGYDGVVVNKDDKPHRFTVTVTFAYQNGSNDSSYVPFKTVYSVAVDCAAQERKEVHGRAEGDSVIQTNFRSIHMMTHDLAMD